MSHRKLEGPPIYSQKGSGDWDRWFALISDKMPLIETYAIAFNPASVAATTTAEQSITVTGVKTGDIVLSVNKPTHTTGLGIVGYRTVSNNTVGVTFANNTAAAIDADEETYIITILRG